MEIRLANTSDIDSILKLQAKNLVTNLNDDEKKDGFVTTPFTADQLESLITLEGVTVGVDQDEVVAYVMTASWHYWVAWPMFEYMASFLETLTYKDQTLNLDNSYQYGPICIDPRYRGSGLFEKVFEFAREHMAKRYAILVTFINKINTRSYEAHVRKLGLEVITEFEFNNNNFYELVYDTSQSIFKES